ncbi:MAG: hypothetical protein Q7T57_08665 [Dehalococcoidales bacterium]|nr:hypothetical protein [Dehalococcoidales bacterium]
MKTMKECILSGVAMLAIGGLAGYGLSLGHDGMLLLTAIAAIAGLAGYQIGKRPPTTKT